MSLKTAII